MNEVNRFFAHSNSQLQTKNAICLIEGVCFTFGGLLSIYQLEYALISFLCFFHSSGTFAYLLFLVTSVSISVPFLLLLLHIVFAWLFFMFISRCRLQCSSRLSFCLHFLSIPVTSSIYLVLFSALWLAHYHFMHQTQL